jgi:branched-chain amino acid aminotransferase
MEKNIEPYDVISADEAFMTGTPFCLLPVTSLNGTVIANGRVGPITKKILDKWSKKVGIDIARQIKKWDDATPPHILKTPSPYHY